ncbi:MAG: hypothetical protein Q8M44_05030, partial [bacterium]|nr:hypothetical protein [bacterium]
IDFTLKSISYTSIFHSNNLSISFLAFFVNNLISGSKSFNSLLNFLKFSGSNILKHSSSSSFFI